MKKTALFLTGLIALLHYYIAWFEIFAWTSRGPKVFSDFPEELFEQTIPLAANQGIYNAFLALGLTWALIIKDDKWQKNVATCFLVFVTIAGVFGALTAATKILFVQAIPALAALLLLWGSGASTKQN